MEIRALTGFNETTRRRYGRSYSPLNGVHLGNIRDKRQRDLEVAQQAPDIDKYDSLSQDEDNDNSSLKKYVKPILIATALGGLFYVLKKKKII
tara:strand:- start:1115 stop:1393 length:279 start_codon:yes stop_codon:yes gene_type:complete